MKSKFIAITVLALCLLPTAVWAGGMTGFEPLVGIPGLDINGKDTFSRYVNALYALAISIAALVAVIKIVLAGAKYMLSDIVTQKSQAKEDIRNALIGLLIIIGAFIILNTINSNLTNADLNAPAITINDQLEVYDIIKDYEGIIEKATAMNSTAGRRLCGEIAWDEYTRNGAQQLDETSFCQNICLNVYQGVVDYSLQNECYYIQKFADQCDPQSTLECCRTIKGGTWDMNATSNKCSGLAEAKQTRMNECYSARKTWNEAEDTCQINRCDFKTNEKCCVLGYKADWSNNSCNLGVAGGHGASTCITEDDGIWDYSSNTCSDKDPKYNYQLVDPMFYSDPNSDPSEVCDVLKEQMGIEVVYVENIRSCRWQI